MQLLQSFPPDLSKSRRFEVSKLFYSSSSSLPSISNNRSKSQQFIPFQQQRDKLGKLLTGNSLVGGNYSYQSGVLLAQSKLYGEQVNSKQKQRNAEPNNEQSKINKVVQIMESRQLARSKFIPKQIKIICEKQYRKEMYFDAEYDIKNGINLVKSKIKDCTIKPDSPTKLAKNLFFSKQSNDNLFANINTQRTKIRDNYNQLGLKKSKSMVQTKQSNLKQSSFIIQKTKQQEKQRKSQSLFNNLKVKLNPEQSQYKRYKQQQERQLKVFDDYEEGHLKFKQKMKQSKLIAYNIKKQLQID